jgi:hypothetical protein
MRFRDILITEITRMSNGKVCVAGIDLSTGRTVRPLQRNGHNWEEDKWVGAGKLCVGNLVQVETIPHQPSDYPHASEDIWISRVVSSTKRPAGELYFYCKEGADPDLQTLFANHLTGDKYIVAKSKCRSLGCLMVPAGKTRAEASFGKVRVIFDDRFNHRHYLTITELETHKCGDADTGAAALQARLRSASGLVALRLGLARAWSGADQEYEPPRCYLQLNGIILPA